MAMAVNVFLVFFFGANPASFRKHLWVYCIICFGAPAIPAIVCLLVPTSDGKIYGDATVFGLPRRNDGFSSLIFLAVVLD